MNQTKETRSPLMFFGQLKFSATENGHEEKAEATIKFVIGLLILTISINPMEVEMSILLFLLKIFFMNTM